MYSQRLLKKVLKQVIYKNISDYKKIPGIASHGISRYGLLYNFKTKKQIIVSDFKHTSGRYKIKNKYYSVEELVNKTYGRQAYTTLSSEFISDFY